jgi:predicted phage terminase large subunit-like protein
MSRYRRKDSLTRTPEIIIPKDHRFQAAIINPIHIKAEKCRRSLFEFMKEFWYEVSTSEPTWNWHLEYLSKQLETMLYRVANRQAKEYDLIINISPGTTKSTLCSVMLNAWAWSNWPVLRFINASYSGALSLEHSELCRDLIRSEKYKKLFPYLEIKQDKDTKTNFKILYDEKHMDSLTGEHSIIQKSGGNRYSTSVGGTLTGFHADVLLVDDPLDPQRAVSDIEVAKANTWIDQTLSTRKVDKAVTPTIIIMQRLHQNDPTGYLLSKKNKKVKHICLPGEIRNYRDNLKPKVLAKYYKDELFDPVRMSWNVLDDLRIDLGDFGYSSQIGQSAVSDKGNLFKVEHFQIIHSMVPNPDVVRSVRYWDKAGTSGAGAYTVGVKMVSLKNGKFLITDVKRGRWSTEQRESIIRQTAEADGIDTIIWHEQEPGSGGKESAESTIRNLAGYITYADRVTRNKEMRADPYSVQVNNGNVLLLNGLWNYDFIEEHRYFPNSTYKDQVDSAAGAFSKVVKRKVAGVIG